MSMNKREGLPTAHFNAVRLPKKPETARFADRQGTKDRWKPSAAPRGGRR